MRSKLIAAFIAAFTLHAQAATIEKPLSDNAQEQTARDIFHQLRCVVCEGQSLAESDAALAVQMRAHVREMVAEGKTNEEIQASFRQSYGDQILMTPPLQNNTLLLWLAPLLLIALGALTIWRVTRTKGQTHG